MIFPASKNKNDFGLSIFVFVYTDESKYIETIYMV